jgi:serine/threonine-protein kinase
MSDNDLQVRAERRIGTVLCGKYRVDRVLGVGGMAVVYAATHRNQKRVAIKMLHPELAMHQELRARFLREGYAANTVDHPGAVAVLDDDTAEDGAAFLVMERLEGEEVDRLWEQRGQRLPVDAVLSIANQLLDVLAAAHAKSIVHRDIKPANLYVTMDGTLKVLDFGIARLRDAAAAGQAATSTGIMLGTPAFMAPEQALGRTRDIDGTTDNWSVGATMFSLLSGRFVHDGETASELVVKSATQPAPSLATVAPHVDLRVVQIVDRALGFDKPARWPTALAMRDAVRAVYLAIVGEKIGKEPLERLVTQASASMGATLPIDAIRSATPPPQRNTPMGPKHVPRVEPTRDMTAIPIPARSTTPETWGPPRSELVGASTSRPVQSNASIERPQGVPRSGSLVLIGLVAAAILSAAVGIGWLVFSRGSSATVSTAVSSAAPAETTLPPAPSSPPPIVAKEAGLPPLETSAAPPPKPPPRSPANSPANAPLPARPVPTPTFLPTPPQVQPSPHPPTTQPNCDPPFTIDLSGHRVPKPECL